MPPFEFRFEFVRFVAKHSHWLPNIISIWIACTSRTTIKHKKERKKNNSNENRKIVNDFCVFHYFVTTKRQLDVAQCQCQYRSRLRKNYRYARLCRLFLVSISNVCLCVRKTNGAKRNTRSNANHGVTNVFCGAGACVYSSDRCDARSVDRML